MFLIDIFEIEKNLEQIWSGYTLWLSLMKGKHPTIIKIPNNTLVSMTIAHNLYR